MGTSFGGNFLDAPIKLYACRPIPVKFETFKTTIRRVRKRLRYDYMVMAHVGQIVYRITREWVEAIFSTGQS